MHHRNWTSKSQSASLRARKPTLGHTASSLEPREKFGSGFPLELWRFCHAVRSQNSSWTTSAIFCERRTPVFGGMYFSASGQTCTQAQRNSNSLKTRKSCRPPIQTKFFLGCRSPTSSWTTSASFSNQRILVFGKQPLFPVTLADIPERCAQADHRLVIGGKCVGVICPLRRYERA